VGEKWEGEKRCDRKCIFSAPAINLLKCSWPDILLVPLIDGGGAKRKWFPHVLHVASFPLPSPLPFLAKWEIGDCCKKQYQKTKDVCAALLIFCSLKFFNKTFKKLIFYLHTKVLTKEYNCIVFTISYCHKLKCRVMLHYLSITKKNYVIAIVRAVFKISTYSYFLFLSHSDTHLYTDSQGTLSLQNKEREKEKVYIQFQDHGISIWRL